MVKNHLKRINAPKSWKIERKASTWITRPHPSGHPLKECMSLSTIFKEMLDYADTTREVKHILRSNEIFVDGRRRVDPKQAVGLMDVLSIPKLKEQYRMLLDSHGNLYLQEIPAKEQNLKLFRIEGKNYVRGGKLQVNLSGGRSVLVKKDEYKVGDSVLAGVPDHDIKEHLPMEEGAVIYLTAGSHVGTMGVVSGVRGKIVEFHPLEDDSETYTTSLSYAFVVGKGKKPALTLTPPKEGDEQ